MNPGLLLHGQQTTQSKCDTSGPLWCRLRLQPGPGRWPQPSPAASVYTSPTLAPPDPGSTLGTPASWRSRSPTGSYQAELAPVPAAPPLRSRTSPSGRPPLPPAPPRGPAQPMASPGTSPASSQQQRRSPPQRRSVRELVRAWSGGGSQNGRERSPPAVTAAAAAVAAADLEGQQLSATHEARAFTWSQLGLSPAASPAASRRVSENAAAPYRLPLPPSQQGEVHSNPVFDWTAAGVAATDGGTLGPAAGSFSQQVKRTASRSRLSRGVSFAEPAGEGSAHGGREGGGHSRRGSFVTPEQGSRREAGGQMSSRPSEQALLQLHCELEGIQE